MSRIPLKVLAHLIIFCKGKKSAPDDVIVWDDFGNASFHAHDEGCCHNERLVYFREHDLTPMFGWGKGRVFCYYPCGTLQSMVVLPFSRLPL